MVKNEGVCVCVFQNVLKPLLLLFSNSLLNSLSLLLLLISLRLTVNTVVAMKNLVSKSTNNNKTAPYSLAGLYLPAAAAFA
jgi:hypothetical protein